MRQAITPNPLPRVTIKPEVIRRILNHESRKFAIPITFVLIHVPLGILLYQSYWLAFVHPWITFGIGLYWAGRPKEKLIRVAWVAVYIVGCEVLWRMARSDVFWEFGKYSIATIMIVALVQRGLWRIPRLPLVYFVLLVPAALLTLVSEEFGRAQGMISFNLSGPLLLFISCWFFSHLGISKQQIKQLFFVLCVPLMTIAFTTLFYTASLDEIDFVNDSMSATSGGFGPNQVSSILGLGVFVSVSAILLFRNSVREQLFLAMLALFLTGSAVITLSRGGIYNAVGGLLAVAAFVFFDFKKSAVKVLGGVGLAVVFLLMVFPYLNDFSGGSLESRFEDEQSSGRIELVQADLKVFAKNPIVGVGVGEGPAARSKLIGNRLAAHTEFSRVIAEHGILGVFALFALGIVLIRQFGSATTHFERALICGPVVWSSLFMLNAGLRLAAPAILWGLCLISVTAPRLRFKKYANHPNKASGPRI